jgi:hypothetical protein
LTTCSNNDQNDSNVVKEDSTTSPTTTSTTTTTTESVTMPIKIEQPEQHLVLETTNFEYNNTDSKLSEESSMILEQNKLELIKRHHHHHHHNSCEEHSSKCNLDEDCLTLLDDENDSKNSLFNNKEQLNELSIKYNYFKHQILNYGNRILVLKIELNRETLCDDSFCFLSNLKPEYARSQFLIKFKDEEGVDYGGVGKEWFHLLSSEIFKPSYGLFVVNNEINQLEINKHATFILPVKRKDLFYYFVII